VRQLTGGNSKVNELVQKLDELVDNETAMMQAETMTGVVHLKAFSLKIQDLTLELGGTMSKLQSDSVDLGFRVTLVQQSQSRTEENTIDIKKVQTQQNSKLDQILQLQLQRTANTGSGKQQNENQETKTSVSEEFKRWKKLAAALGVEGARESNKAFYERIRNERVKGTTEWILEDTAVQSWFQGGNPFVVVSGNTGNGKTFIASRIVEELIANKPNTGNLDKAVSKRPWREEQCRFRLEVYGLRHCCL
jgi:predicted kinase